MTSKSIYISGEFINGVEFLREAEYAINTGRKGIFKCKCGNEFTTLIASVKSKNTSTCGCNRNSRHKNREDYHGMSNTDEYHIWIGIKKRCYNTNAHAYKNYGDRGIFMSEEWRNDFMAFYRDMGDRPSNKHSIERVKNDLGYSKDNCKWATSAEQSNNTRTNVFLELNGENLTVAQWSVKLGISRNNLYNRINLGWTVEEILSTQDFTYRKGFYTTKRQ